jgi:hypothetical protein
MVVFDPSFRGAAAARGASTTRFLAVTTVDAAGAALTAVPAVAEPDFRGVDVAALRAGDFATAVAEAPRKGALGDERLLVADCVVTDDVRAWLFDIGRSLTFEKSAGKCTLPDSRRIPAMSQR